ncbi:IS5/IS1182 family transposase, partial [Spongiactinospora sp. 9N601]
KRGIATDVLGLLIAVVVTAASVHDNAIAADLLDVVAIDAPTVHTAWVDARFKNTLIEHGATLGIDVLVVQPEPGTKGFVPVPKRWAAEQAFGTLMWHRRLVRDYERRPASSRAWIHWAMIDNMTRRLTGSNTISWRTPPAPVAAATA